MHFNREITYVIVDAVKAITVSNAIFIYIINEEINNHPIFKCLIIKSTELMI
jgi:hypothetical protein